MVSCFIGNAQTALENTESPEKKGLAQENKQRKAKGGCKETPGEYVASQPHD
jgi:hypothetical protein